MIANYITFQKELQRTSWIKDEIRFLVNEGAHYYYTQDWHIEGVQVMRFRYCVDIRTSEVMVWSELHKDWIYSHKLFEV